MTNDLHKRIFAARSHFSIHLFRLFTLKQSPNASAAAVPSSKREELATSSPVSSVTMV